jgi:hypothetical protein
MVAAIDRIGTLCKVEAVNTMVPRTSDDGLGGGNSHVVTTIVGIEEFPEGVIVFFSIVAFDTIWYS